MAGIKGKSGGKREGAGRKKNPPDKLNSFEDIDEIYPQMQTSDKELIMPKEFAKLPYAKRAWEYVIDLDKNSKYKLLNARHLEAVKSYCLAVEMRDTLIAEWEKTGRAASIMAGSGVYKINPIIEQMNKANRHVNECSAELGLTIMSEFRWAKENFAETLNADDEKNEDSLFD